MASITPRASGLWEETNRMSYFDNDGSEDDDLERQDGAPDERTALDKTIDKIGMGSYQWTLLSLCGFGWMADNMWMQAIAIILPRVQRHYSVPDSYIGTVSSSMFAGMMFGAVGWGTCSDLMGRSTAFNATLFFTSVFGLLASFATSFPMLCVLLFFLGSAVGGSMPTDGTLLLEHMPKGKQYLLTALSVFFSVGSVLSAVVALLVVPQHSCRASDTACDVATENQGWRYLLITLGLITLLMFLARMVFFKLHESPRYLVHAGRPQEALESLQMISRFNGSELSLELEDVDDVHPSHTASPTRGGDESQAPFLKRRSPSPKRESPTNGDATVIFDADATNAAPRPELNTQRSAEFLRPTRPSILIKDYNATGESANSLDVHIFSPDHVNISESPVSLRTAYDGATPAPAATVFDAAQIDDPAPARPRPPPLQLGPQSRRQSRRLSAASAGRRRASSIYEERVCAALPRWVRRPLRAWWDRVGMVLGPEWLRTTLLVWAVWCSASLAYTMFNVFLPKLLETSAARREAAPAKTLEESLWDVVIFTMGGCPGAILGAYLVESSLGRRWSLAGSTFCTAILCIVFVHVQSPLAVRASTVGISLSATTMWAVLYGWTPEIFGTKVRGTACGIASALSRIGGMVAPMLGGVLLMIDRSVPVYTSVAVFVIAGLCTLLLHEDSGDGRRAKRGAAMAH